MRLVPKNTKKFLSYVKPYRWLVVWATVCGLLKYNIPVLFPWILKNIINHLLTNPSPQMTVIHRAMVILLGLYIVYMVATYYRSYFADTAGQRLIFDLRRELYVHLQRMSLSFFGRQQVGSISSRLIGDINVAQNFVGAAFTNTMMDISSLLFITALLFSMNPNLALISIAVFPFYVVLNNHFKNKIRQTSKLAQQKMEEIAGSVTEKLGGISIIQSFTREKVEERHFFQDTRIYLSHRIANIKNNALAAAIIGFLTSIAPVFVVWVGAYQVIQRRLTVGELTAFYAYLGMFYQPLNRLTELNLLLANSQAAIDRIFEVFDIASEIVDKPGAKEIKTVRGDIAFRHLSFSYDPPKKILDDIDLSIPAGSMTALGGPSGAGKSTFIRLIPRFYEATQGVITIDGIDIRDFQLKSLRRQIALVPQEPILFSGTIYENILMGKPDAEEEDVIQAARSANAHEFIVQMPAGYQSEVGEGGLRLSGGQKQRIALARAFLKNAPILILDEATSSLDSESEELIQSALKKLMVGRTTLVIAHRLSTIQSADRIVVLDDGKIVEIGRHTDLISIPDGLYRKLYEKQFKNSIL
ncbi:MAG: ABC transporter ATP-binding protein [bacterium]